MRVIVGKNCGNSPRNLLIKNFIVAFEKCNTKFVKKNITEDANWEIIGEKTVSGKDNFIREMLNSKTVKPEKLIIDSIISHGKTGAVSGVLEFRNNKNLAFCHVIKMNNFSRDAVVKEMSSFIIKV